MPPTTDFDEVHRAIGEFVVFFQTVEDTYRQIGWFIVDPNRTTWPPRQFRRESNRELIDKVTDLLLDLVDQHSFPNGEEKARDAEELRVRFHSLRKLRNRVVHSAYWEVKGGGEVAAILRTSPRIEVDEDTGEVTYDQETFDAEAIRRELATYGESFFKLHVIRIQLVHWNPFARFKK